MNERSNEKWWGALSEKERQRILWELCLLQGLPLFYRTYYKLKAGYYEMSRNIPALGVALAVLLIGIISYFLGIHPIASVALVLLGIILGVISIWEIERRR